MKQLVMLLAVVVFFAGTAGAQSKIDDSATPLISGAPAVADSSAVPSDASQDAATPQLFAAVLQPANAEASGEASDAASSAQVSTSRDPVQSVFPSYNWEAYIGYTFLRFEVAPSVARSTNGLNVASQYYFHTGALGIDGEGIATFAPIAGQTGKFWAGLVGARYRFAAPRGLEVWVHGLVGGAKFLPQTALGGQTGFAYETGAGVDIGAFGHRRLAFRFAGDMVGTRFFSHDQFSPKISAGIVFKY
jgi:hypothetical protein